MAERDFSVLEQYEYKVYQISRGRGAFICETNKGVFLLREYNGKEEKLLSRARLLEYLAGKNLDVDYYVKNRSGEYISKTEESDYTLSHWFTGRECDTKAFGDTSIGIRGLAEFHNVMDGYEIDDREEFQIARSLNKEYDKHNRELKMIRNYLSDKHRKNDFELLAASKCQEFLEEGYEAENILKQSGYVEAYNQAVECKKLCHGDFNYHNIFIEGGDCSLCGFEQVCVNIELFDLYNYMRKLMEKYDWDVKLGYLMLREYDSVRALSDKDIRILGAMFSYPEKFWKILNYYFNANKAWIPAKSQEKLKLAVCQNRMRKEFVRTLLG